MDGSARQRVRSSTRPRNRKTFGRISPRTGFVANASANQRSARLPWRSSSCFGDTRHPSGRHVAGDWWQGWAGLRGGVGGRLSGARVSNALPHGPPGCQCGPSFPWACGGNVPVQLRAGRSLSVTKFESSARPTDRGLGAIPSDFAISTRGRSERSTNSTTSRRNSGRHFDGRPIEDSLPWPHARIRCPRSGVIRMVARSGRSRFRSCTHIVTFFIGRPAPMGGASATWRDRLKDSSPGLDESAYRLQRQPAPSTRQQLEELAQRLDLENYRRSSV